VGGKFQHVASGADTVKMAGVSSIVTLLKISTSMKYKMKFKIFLLVSILVSLDLCVEASQGQLHYDDAMFVSKNYPKLKMGVINGNEGWLTDKNVVFQHFRVVRGLCSNEGTISFESVISPGNFLRHQGFKIYLHPRQDSRLYRFDACFYPKYDKFFKGYTAFQSVNYPNYYIRHSDFRLLLRPVENNPLYRNDVSWKTTVPEVQYTYTYSNAIFESINYPGKKMGIKNGVEGWLTEENPALQHYSVVEGLCGVAGTVSFRSVAFPTMYLRHQNYKIYLHAKDSSDLYKSDACFFPRYNKYFTGYTAYESVNYPNFYIRHRGFRLWLEKEEDKDLYRKDVSWKTKISQGQHVSTYADAILQSKNILNYNVGIEHGNQGWITKKSPKLQHFSVVQGTCGVEGTVSFESVTRTGSFLRHQGFKIFLHRFEETELYKNDACFYPRYDKYFEGYTAYESVNYPGKFIRHKDYRLYINTDDGTPLFRNDASWKTTIPPSQYVRLYSDATFRSINYPDRRIGIENKVEGWATFDSDMQHWKVVQGLCGKDGTISFESVARPGHFLRHQNFNFYLHPRQSSTLYKEDACFFPRYSKYFKGYTAFESVNYPNYYIRHQEFKLYLRRVENTALFRLDVSWKIERSKNQMYLKEYKDASFVSYNFPTHKIGLQRNGIEGKLSNDNVAYQHYRLVPGLCNVPGTVSFESVANPGQYLRHRGFKMYLLRSDGSDLFRSDACFFPRFNKYFEGYTACESVNYPGFFVRHRDWKLRIDRDDGSELFKKDASWKIMIPRLPYASKYSDAVFVSRNYPGKKMSIKNSVEGWLTNENPVLQHYSVVEGLCGVAGTVSFRSVVFPTMYLRHQNYKIYLHAKDTSDLYKSDACFFPRYNKCFPGFTAYESVNYPNFFIRHRGFRLRLEKEVNRDLYRNDVSWKTVVKY